MFQNYDGNEKYHFRLYRVSRYHPFLVILVTDESEINGKKKITGFNLTHSITMVLQRPNKFIKLNENPNPIDDSDSYLCIDIVSNADSKLFTAPLKKWKVSKEDEIVIDDILQRKYPEVSQKVKREE